MDSFTEKKGCISLSTSNLNLGSSSQNYTCQRRRHCCKNSCLTHILSYHFESFFKLFFSKEPQSFPSEKIQISLSWVCRARRLVTTIRRQLGAIKLHNISSECKPTVVGLAVQKPAAEYCPPAKDLYCPLLKEMQNTIIVDKFRKKSRKYFLQTSMQSFHLIVLSYGVPHHKDSFRRYE